MPFSDISDPDRLRRLVDAVLTIGSDLSLAVVLQRIVESAVNLFDARFGAVGVLDGHGHGLASSSQWASTSP